MPSRVILAGRVTGLAPATSKVTAWILDSFGSPSVDQAGLEPARPGVWNRSSATELLIVAYPRRDSNSDWQVRNLLVSPLAYEGAVPAARAERAPPPRHGGALPLSYAGLATPTGFEPVPSTVTGWRTGQLC
jgi:hypothetical protein